MGRSTFLKLTAVCLISSSVPASMALSAAVDAAHAMGLIARADTCNGAAGYSPCNQGLPSSFCCGPQTICVPFNNGASAICCPLGRPCNSIQPIPCDISRFNATQFPMNPLHSTDLTTGLPTCGTNTCCPVGYNCQNGNCFVNSPSSTSSTTSTPSATSTSSSTASASTTSSAGAAAAQSSPSDCQCDKFPAVAVLAGFFPGLVFGALIAVLVLTCWGRRRESKRDSADFGHIAAKVSDPIYQDTDATRTDFLRRGSDTRNGVANITSTPSRVRSLFSRSPTLKHESPGNGMRDLMKTPESRTGHLPREPSMESIKIYSPPDGRLTRNTTFADMMASAGLRKDEPYLGYSGSPGVVDPRTRGVSGGVGGLR